MLALYSEFQRLLLGPLGDLQADPEITEILINGTEAIYVERAGLLEPVSFSFPGGDWQLAALARNIAEAVDRPLDLEHPILDARLADGSRVHIVIPPCAKQVHINLRPFRRIISTLADLVARQAIAPAIAELLEKAVYEGRNIVIAGATGSGKSTVLNALATCIPLRERVVVIEDTTELNLSQPHVVALEARPAGAAGGPVTIRDLFVASLRMRPDRIVIGEVRRGEALDVVQAMLAGQAGVMTTLHADSPRAALIRLETLCLMTDVPLPAAVVRRQLATGIDLVVHLARDQQGVRRVTGIASVSPGKSGGWRIKPFIC